MNENRCIVCNKVVPEGRMVCPTCEWQQIKTGMILQSNQATEDEVRQAYEFIKKKEDINNE